MGTAQRRWWWPYFHPVVVSFTMALLVFSVVVGSSAAIISTARGTFLPWVEWTRSINLEYDFAWSELTEGEGSLFWIISTTGFDPDPKNIAKFPLYPAVVRAIWEITDHRMTIPFALWLVHAFMVWSGLAELFRFWEAYRPGLGSRAVKWILFSPLFMLHLWIADYIEPGFVALFWICLSLERQQKWAWSGFTLTLLVMIQPSGIFLAALLGLRRLHQFFKKEVNSAAVIWMFLPAFTWLGWMALTSIWFDRSFAPYAFQEEWGRTVWRWPWDRWNRWIHRSVEQNIFSIQHIFMNISLYWILAGFVKGGQLWTRLTNQNRDLFLGWWVMPLFSVFLIVVPFATYVYGPNRYAICSIVGVWPLLYSAKTMDEERFRRYEKRIWIFGAIGSLIIIFAFVTGLCDDWGLYF